MPSHTQVSAGSSLSDAVAQVRLAMGEDHAGPDGASAVFRALNDMIALVPSEDSLATLLALVRELDNSDYRVRVGLVAIASMMEVAGLSRRPMEHRHAYTENMCGSILYSAAADALPESIEQEVVPGSQVGLQSPGAVLTAHFPSGISLELALHAKGEAGHRRWRIEGGIWPRQVDTGDVEGSVDIAGRIYPRIDNELVGQGVPEVSAQIIAAITRLARLGHAL